jgi:hypothetical protein
MEKDKNNEIEQVKSELRHSRKSPIRVATAPRKRPMCAVNPERDFLRNIER